MNGIEKHVKVIEIVLMRSDSLKISGTPILRKVVNKALKTTFFSSYINL